MTAAKVSFQFWTSHVSSTFNQSLITTALMIYKVKSRKILMQSCLSDQEILGIRASTLLLNFLFATINKPSQKSLFRRKAWWTSERTPMSFLTLPILLCVLVKYFFWVFSRRSGPPAMARMIASAIRSSWRQRLTAASKSPMRSAWVISPSTSVAANQIKTTRTIRRAQSVT